MKLTPAEAQALRAARARDAVLDGARRRSEGIVHTPPELARFVARAVDEVLRAQLALDGGIADARVALVDPASGPGAFVAAAHAVGGGRASRPRAVLALERDAGVGEGARLELDWPLELRAVDTLREAQPHELAGLAPVLAVLGNPPWVGSAQERPAPWLDALLDELRREATGEPLQERKLGVLSDAYVRFFAWALGATRAAEQGAVLGFVTNGSYLDGPVHRGVRAALLRSFDALWVVDLGGNALLARTSERDGNVFGVRTSVAVLIAARGPRARARAAAPLRELGRLRYVRLHGSARDKLERLASSSLDALPFREHRAAAPAHRFAPEAQAPADYLAFPSLDELMPFHREGVQTNRDAVVVDVDRARLLARLRAFAAGERTDALAEAERVQPHYDPERARLAVRQALEREPERCAVPLAYRPLDDRWFLPIAPLCHRPRPELLAAMQHSSFALVSARKDRGGVPWRHASAARIVIDNCYLSTRSSCRARAFPTHTPQGADNLDPALRTRFEERAERTVTAPELAAYALACLASPTYQAAYATWLRVDYPRVPLPASAVAYARLLALGERLRELLVAPLDAELLLSPLDPTSEGEDDEAALVIGHHRVLERFASGRRQRLESSASRAELVRLRPRIAAIQRVLAELTRGAE